MSRPDLAALAESGAAARRLKQSYYENPAFTETTPIDTDRDLLEWHDAACAWAGGWLRQDEGRDTDLACVLRVRCQ